jgi:hypothetical protein
MYNWMQPPAADIGDPGYPPALAYLSQRWHGGDYPGDEPSGALDWKETPGYAAAENVYYRSRNAAPNDIGADWVAATGLPYQYDYIPCGADYIAQVRVNVRAKWDGIVKGVTAYQHTLVTRTTLFDIWFKAAGSWSNARFNNVVIGRTRSEAATKNTNCWDGWHVHENNRDTQYWDSLNHGYYDTASLCKCHDVEIKDTWTRRLHWTES